MYSVAEDILTSQRISETLESRFAFSVLTPPLATSFLSMIYKCTQEGCFKVLATVLRQSTKQFMLASRASTTLVAVP